jgi:hypothetical protein
MGERLTLEGCGMRRSGAVALAVLFVVIVEQKRLVRIRGELGPAIGDELPAAAEAAG